MSAVTSTTIDQLTILLANQRDNLGQQSLADGNTKDQTNQTIHEIMMSDGIVRIETSMSMEKIHRPDGMTYCGGKVWKDTAKVTVTPANSEVIKTVTEHFKSQVIKPMWSPSVPAFDVVEINELFIPMFEPPRAKYQ